MNKNSKESLKERLTPLQYDVTQNEGTERAFKNEFYDSKKIGIYACIVCGLKLFDSQYKYDSGTGWPSFYQFEFNAVDKKKDGYDIEVHCSKCQAHLGHEFNDGPKDKTGKRYCINSASLSFQQKL